MGFQNPVVGGTALRIPAIQSPDFQSGASGWIIRIDGSAEFNSVIIRGSSGAVAITIGPASGPQVVIDSTASGGYIEFPTHAPGETTTARVSGTVVNSGTAAETLALTHRGPADNSTDRIDIIQRSDFFDGSSEAQFRLDLNGTSSLLIVDKTNGLQSNRQVLVTTSSASVRPLELDAPSGQTAELIRVRTGATEALTMDKDGIFTTYAENTFATYTPTWGNIGTATLSTNTGWWQRIGPMIFFTAYGVFNAAGSGATDVTVTAPVSLYRGTRQVMTLNYSNVFGAGNIGNGSAVSLSGGSGAVIDKLRASDQGAANSDASITGADITASSIITITGWCREL